MHKINLFLLSVLLLTQAAIAQDNDFSDQNMDSVYKRADSIALSIRYTSDIEQATRLLTEPCGSAAEKYRCIFRWIAEHISYDMSLYNKGMAKDKTPEIKCRNIKECEAQWLAFYQQYCKPVLKKKAATADGYARLYKLMCMLAELPCEVVDGYGKVRDSEIDSVRILPNHAWNAVPVGENWYFTDVAWAAGSCNINEKTDKATYFNKNFSGWYFMQTYTAFLINHYPKEERWMRLLPGYSRTAFYQQPFYYSTDITRYIEQTYQQEKGLIKITNTDTLLCYTYRLTPNEQQLYSERKQLRFVIGYKLNQADKDLTYPEILNFGDRVHYCIPLRKKTPAALVIYFNNVPAIKQKFQYKL